MNDVSKATAQQDGADYQMTDGHVFHMCRKSRWEEAVQNKRAYLPPTFQKDGRMTHASNRPHTLLKTANHFYKSDPDLDWICLEVDLKVLWEQLGMVIMMESPKSVGEKQPPKHEQQQATGKPKIQFPHIYGGIPTALPGVVTKLYKIERASDGTFLSIPGLIE